MFICFPSLSTTALSSAILLTCCGAAETSTVSLFRGPVFKVSFPGSLGIFTGAKTMRGSYSRTRLDLLSFPRFPVGVRPAFVCDWIASSTQAGERSCLRRTCRVALPVHRGGTNRLYPTLYLLTPNHLTKISTVHDTCNSLKTSSRPQLQARTRAQLQLDPSPSVI
jgi:hypothetical protein